ncbi:hypothetical protein BDZ97DRAFT_1758129 [Flammula alnicola]|nr:hypothetical protein BDZ97DRAFT_1758129 [Flammula alnicola]
MDAGGVSTDEVSTNPSIDDSLQLPLLAFEDLGDPDFRQVNSGPRVSSLHNNPQHHYGPVTIRNYLAGHAKKALRTSKVKGSSEFGDVFLRLPVELQLMASKSFRSIIMNPKAAGVWKIAFERHPSLPKALPNTSHSAWAFMIYGPGVCCVCGRLGGLTDFAFRKRYCEQCMKNYYAYPSALKDTKGATVPSDHPVCFLLPRSYRYHGLRYTTAYSNLANAQYLEDDFNAMMKKVTLIQLLIAHEVPQLAELYEEYREALRARMVEVNEEYAYKLTPRAFRKLRPKLEAIVTKRKVERLKIERNGLIEGFMTIEGFQEFLNAKFDARGDLETEYAVSLFPPFISGWTKEKQEYILSLFPASQPEQDFETKLKKLDLAVSVFTCLDCKIKARAGRALVGWDNICRHMRSRVACHEYPCSKYEINGSASAAAACLVSCVGLDPATATIADMDEHDRRFLCGNCLKTYTWVECIEHAVEMQILGSAMHDTPAWLLLTPEATKFVKEHEYPHPRPVASVWRCNMCATHYTEHVTQDKAIEHMKAVHLVKEPEIGVDVVPDKRWTIRRRKHFRLDSIQPTSSNATDIKFHWGLEGEDWVKINVIGAAAAAITILYLTPKQQRLQQPPPNNLHNTYSEYHIYTVGAS